MSTHDWFHGAVLAAITTLAGIGGSGCKWSEFDAIKDDAVVVSTTKPDNKSTIWGVGLVPARHAVSGTEAGVLGVFGASEPTYNEIVYAAAGGATIGKRQLRLKDLAYASINANPLTASAEDTDDIALVAVPTTEGVAFHGKSEQLTATALPGSTQPDAAAFVKVDAGGAPTLVVADEDKLYTVEAAGASICSLTGAGVALHVRGLAGVRAVGDTADSILVWAEDRSLYLFPPAVVGTGCAGGTMDAPLPVATTTFAPKAGSRILKLGAPLAGEPAAATVLLVGVNESQGMLAVYAQTGAAPATYAPVGAAVETDGSYSATILELADARYVALGFPHASVDNVQAGQVRLYDVDATTGAGAVALVLNDSRPEDSESFGRAVAALPYNGTQVLTVAADNEVFLYYRTELYDETRVRGQ